MLVMSFNDLHVEQHEPLPAIVQELGDSAATSPTVKHGQPSMMPKWSERRQVGQTVMQNERGVTVLLYIQTGTSINRNW